MFDKFIDPILCYGCESWGFHDAPHVERVQLRFFKRILGVKCSTQNDFVYGVLGRVPMIIRRHCRIIKYWLKIVCGKKSVYVNALYMSSLENIEQQNAKNNWANNVRRLLCSNGFGDIWRAQGIFNPNAFYNAFKNRLYDVFRQEWSARISESPRARFFRAVITEHSLHHILDIVNVPAHRASLIRLICSSHRLGVETGRWTRPVTPQENRKCTVCNILDDEYHLLLECTVFNDFRKKLVKKHTGKGPQWTNANHF